MAGFTIGALINSLTAMSNKVSQQMRYQIQRNVIKPLNPNGLITHTNITVDKKSDTLINIHSNLPNYAWFADYGRLPGRFPPYEEGTPLYKWAQRHPWTDPNTGKPVSTKSSAFLLARKIAKKGTKHDYSIYLTLYRLVHLIEKTLPNAVVTEFKAKYHDIVYDGTELVRNIEIKL